MTRAPLEKPEEPSILLYHMGNELNAFYAFLNSRAAMLQISAKLPAVC